MSERGSVVPEETVRDWRRYEDDRDCFGTFDKSDRRPFINSSIAQP